MQRSRSISTRHPVAIAHLAFRRRRPRAGTAATLHLLHIL
jgi:hypothetical protein